MEYFTCANRNCIKLQQPVPFQLFPQLRTYVSDYRQYAPFNRAELCTRDRPQEEVCVGACLVLFPCQHHCKAHTRCPLEAHHVLLIGSGVKITATYQALGMHHNPTQHMIKLLLSLRQTQWNWSSAMVTNDTDSFT